MRLPFWPAVPVILPVHAGTFTGKTAKMTRISGNTSGIYRNFYRNKYPARTGIETKNKTGRTVGVFCRFLFQERPRP